MKIAGRGVEYGVQHFKVSTPAAAGDFLCKHTCLSEAAITELIWLGAIYVNQKRCASPEAQLCDGDRVRVHTTPRRFQTVSLKPRIIFEDSDFLILDKPAGLPVHALTDNARENIITRLGDELQKPMYITHRLDVPTSGLLIIAKTQEMQAWFNTQIAKRDVRRTYRAFVEKEVALGEYNHWMKPSFVAPKVINHHQQPDWLNCVLEVIDCRLSDAQVVESVFGLQTRASLVYELHIQLGTGRAQQIRAQLASIGAPIIGDVTYGGRVCTSLVDAIALQAFALNFRARQGDWMTFEIQPNRRSPQ